MLRQSNRSDGRRIGNEYDEIANRLIDVDRPMRARTHGYRHRGRQRARYRDFATSVLVERWWRVATCDRATERAKRISLLTCSTARIVDGGGGVIVVLSLSMVRFTRRRRTMREVRGRSERKTLNAKNNYCENALINVKKKIIIII